MNQVMMDIGRRAEAGHGCTLEEARYLVNPHTELEAVLYWASRVRRAAFGDEVGLCAIVNARAGRCSEDCRYCAQSSHYDTEAEVYPLLSAEMLIRRAEEARLMGAGCFGIVTSGATLTGPELDVVCEAVHHIRWNMHYTCSGSFGRMSDADFRKLYDAGMRVYHHNLETSEAFYPSICSTHVYAERVDTVRRAQAAGFSVCCGGLLGLGEDWEDRIQLAAACRDLGVASVPLNFLYPVEGTPLAGQPPMPPLDILRTLALFRLMMPRTGIRICGGRERNLHHMQSWIFHAGANAMMIGNYLTTQGRRLEDDRQLVIDAGLRWSPCLCGAGASEGSSSSGCGAGCGDGSGKGCGMRCES